MRKINFIPKQDRISSMICHSWGWINYRLLQQQNYFRFSMFSLADQIEKFEETVLTLPQSIMTLDERFLGGGIKMQDLIQQNSFIIQEMRKFKSVFLNYCKLNDKIYHKIIEHQVNSNEHYNKILIVSSGIDRKLQLYEHENKKTKQYLQAEMFGLRELFQTGFKDLKEECGKKVGQQGFVERVKQIVEQYEGQNASSSVPSDTEVRNKDGEIISIPGKKRRGLSLQDIEALKSQMMPLIEQINQKVTHHTIRINDANSTLNSHSSKLTKQEQQQKWLTEDVFNIRKSIDEIKQFAVQEDLKVVELLRETINENVWYQRLQNFREKTLAPLFENLSSKFYRGIQDLRSDVDQNVKPKFTDLNSQLTKIRQKEKALEAKIGKNQEKYAEIWQKIAQNKQESLHQLHEVSKKLQKQIADQAIIQKSHHDKMEQSLKQLKVFIDSIVNTTEELVLKKVEHKIGKQMKEIRGEISQLNRKTSQINTNVKLNGEQVGHVKDVVATKANYTDLIMYFDKKADKQEFKELQELFSDSPKGSNNNFNINEYESQRKLTEEKKRRRSSYSKRMTTPIYTRPEEDSTKHLLAGWDTPDVKQTNKNILKNSHHNVSAKLKNKSMRPSTANTLFLF